jgi:hypothetical protein
MTTNRLSSGGGSSHFVSAYRASEWAMMARANGDKVKAKAWEDAERDCWDDHHFSLTRREELADKNPGAFGPGLEYRGERA